MTLLSGVTSVSFCSRDSRCWMYTVRKWASETYPLTFTTTHTNSPYKTRTNTRALNEPGPTPHPPPPPGPMELLGLLRQDGKLDRVLTVAQEVGPVPSSQGPATVAEYSFDDCPDLEVLVVPGGQGTRREVYNEILLQFLRDQYENQSVQYIFSVCTGAALLAAAGILNDCRATTNKISFDWVVSNDKSQQVVWINSNARWVLHGRILTSAGVSAGMDAALALISTTWSRHVAEDVARRAEYVWVSRGDENT